MSQSGSGRVRRTAFVALTTLGVFVGIAGASLLAGFWSSPAWQSQLEPLLGRPDESRIWSIMIGLLIVEASLILVAYPFSFDPRATRRPRLGMGVVLISAGLLTGTAVLGPKTFLAVDILSAGGLCLLVAYAAVLPLAWLSIEALAAGFLERIVKRADERKRAAVALFLSRVLLLFRPGKRETLRSVALERFRRGDRSEQTAGDLQMFFDAGDNAEEILDALCRLAAERRDPTRYLFFLHRLHLLRPDDPDLAEALIEENLAQDHKAEALRLIEQKGVGDSLGNLERYGRLLLALNEMDRAFEVAQKITDREGIPFTVSGEFLRRILEARPPFFPAVNLLGEQALASRNLDRAIRRWEESLRLEPNQPRLKRRLLDLYREANQTKPLEGLLLELLAEPENRRNLDLATEYADVLLANEKLSEARGYLSKLAGEYPDHFEVLDRYASVLCSAETWKEAAEVNKQALALATQEEERARCRNRTARIERALLSAEVYDLQLEVEVKPRDADLALQLIRRFVETSQLERAVNQADGLLRRVPEARPRTKELLRELGLLPGGPFILLSFLADLHVEDAEYDPILTLIEPMRERSLTPDAVEEDLCLKILRRVPNHLEILRRMGELTRRNHRFAEMVHYYVLFVAHGGQSNETINRSLFEAYENLNDFPNAKSYGQGLLDMHPEDDNVPLRLAHLAFKAGKLDDALHFATLAHDRNPSNFETARLLAKVDRIRRESQAAELQKRFDDGRASPDEIETLADLYHSLDALEKAIPLYQRAARDPARAVRAKAKLALSLAQKGLCDLADETVAGLQVPPDSEETPIVLDLLYRLAGEFEAERMLERAGRVYKVVFLVDAGYRDVVKKVEKFG